MAKDTYMLPRNMKEAERLDQQGRSLEAALDYMIHPALAATLPSSPVIADIGTGTGDFLVRLSKNYPNDSRFYGFDIASDQFQTEIPSNLSLHEHDVKKPFPSKFHHQFDLVHLRLLVLGLDKDDWEIATRNAIELLRPGGSIQWLELDLTSSRQLRGGPAGSTLDNLRFALRAFNQQKGNPRIRWGFNTLPGIFEAVGLSDVTQDVVASDRVVANRKITTHNGLEGVLAWVRKAQENGRSDLYEGQSIEEVARRAREDIENGAYSRYDLYCTIGRMPTGSKI